MSSGTRKLRTELRRLRVELQRLRDERKREQSEPNERVAVVEQRMTDHERLFKYLAETNEGM